jgi:hypothetical protein
VRHHPFSKLFEDYRESELFILVIVFSYQPVHDISLLPDLGIDLKIIWMIILDPASVDPAPLVVGYLF